LSVSLPCHLAHTRQPLGYASLALCRVRAGLMGVLLDQRPSLLILRQRFPVFVRLIHRYYAAVRLLEDVRAGRAAICLPPPACRENHYRRLRGLPVLVRGVSGRAWGLRLRRTGPELALPLLTVLPSALSTASASRLLFFEARYPAHPYPCLRFTRHLAVPGAKLRAEWLAMPSS
jgi:hypothetical protein